MPEKQKEWLKADWDNINDWNAFGKESMFHAVNMVQDVIKQNKDILFVIDSDVDGYTSSSILMNYLYTIEPEWAKSHMSYLHHFGKEHGLNDILDRIMDCFPDFVVVPDGGTNDIKAMKALNDVDIDVLVLDHHPIEKNVLDNGCSFVLNVQASNYPNKHLTGAGVAWQFCRAMDELFPREIGPQANNFLDLCALGNCGDMADSRELEIRALMNLGFSNIKNPFFFQMCKQHEYTLNKRNGLNYLSVAFAVVPFINAVTRSGTMEEKDMVFQGLLTQYAFDKVDSSKRGAHEQVYRYQEAVTVADRVKRRQDKIVNETMEVLNRKIQEQHLTDNAILLLLCEPDEIEANHCGLIANKCQAKYQHPTLVLRKTKNRNDKEYFYRGSCRNYSFCSANNLKEVLEKTGDMEFVAGHNNAAGCGIAESKIQDFIRHSNELYKDVDFTPVYWVDFIWKPSDLNAATILEIAELDIWGQEMPQSTVVVEDIPLSAENVQLLGLAKGNPTLKIECNGVEFMKFKSSEDEYEQFIQSNTYLTIVGTCSKNVWQDVVKPQIMIDDFELEQKWVF